MHPMLQEGGGFAQEPKDRMDVTESRRGAWSGSIYQGPFHSIQLPDVGRTESPFPVVKSRTLAEPSKFGPKRAPNTIMEEAYGLWGMAR